MMINTSAVLRVSSALVILSVLLLCGRTALSIQGGQADAEHNLQRNAIVRLKGAGGCTGTLVSRRHVLTAGHCFDFGPRIPEGLDATTCDPNRVPDSWECVGEWYKLFPNPSLADGMTSGVKRSDGSVTLESGIDRKSFDYSTSSATSAAACQTKCARDARCDAFTFGSTSGNCWLKEEGRPLWIGSSVASPEHTITATHYMSPGFEDMQLWLLSEPVPRDWATPIVPITRLPKGQEMATWLKSPRFEMVGFGAVDAAGTAATERRTAAARYKRYPLSGSQPNKIQVEGERCATVRGGDSGGPLLISQGATLRLVGVLQGTETCGGRYALSMARGGWNDSLQWKADVASWLEEELRVSGIDWKSEGMISGAKLIAVNTHGVLYAYFDGSRVVRKREPGGTIWEDLPVSIPTGRVPVSMSANASAVYLLMSDSSLVEYPNPPIPTPLPSATTDLVEFASYEDDTLDFQGFLALDRRGFIYGANPGGVWTTTSLAVLPHLVHLSSVRSRTLGVFSDGSIRLTYGGMSFGEPIDVQPAVIDIATANVGQASALVYDYYIYRLDRSGELWSGSIYQGDRL